VEPDSIKQGEPVVGLCGEPDVQQRDSIRTEREKEPNEIKLEDSRPRERKRESPGGDLTNKNFMSQE
jgi:hypothetical protein